MFLCNRLVSDSLVALPQTGIQFLWHSIHSIALVNLFISGPFALSFSDFGWRPIVRCSIAVHTVFACENEGQVPSPMVLYALYCREAGLLYCGANSSQSWRAIAGVPPNLKILCAGNHPRNARLTNLHKTCTHMKTEDEKAPCLVSFSRSGAILTQRYRGTSKRTYLVADSSILTMISPGCRFPTIRPISSIWPLPP